MDIIILLFDVPAVASFIYEIIQLKKLQNIPEKTDDNKDEIKRLKLLLIVLGVIMIIFNGWYGTIYYIASRF